jgi:hypothetical protein
VGDTAFLPSVTSRWDVKAFSIKSSLIINHFIGHAAAILSPAAHLSTVKQFNNSTVKQLNNPEIFEFLNF